MFDVAVIEDPAAAEASLDPIRARLLAELAEPGSATMLAARVGLPRQKVNYHLRDAGAARAGRAGRGAAQGQRHRAGDAGDRRVLRDLPGRAGRGRSPTRPASPDRLSARWLLALRRPAGPRRRRRCITGAARARQAASRRSRSTARCGSPRPPTGRRSPRSWPHAVTALVSKYHDESRPGGREPPGDRRRPPEHPRGGARDRIARGTGELTMTHAFELEHEIALTATPEQVWEAIATGPGIDSWFMGRNEVEPREGGVARAWTPAGHREEAPITAWEPGAALRLPARATAEDGRSWPSSTSSRAATAAAPCCASCTAASPGDDWETEYDALRRGWPCPPAHAARVPDPLPRPHRVPVFAMAPRAAGRRARSGRRWPAGCRCRHRSSWARGRTRTPRIAASGRRRGLVGRRAHRGPHRRRDLHLPPRLRRRADVPSPVRAGHERRRSRVAAVADRPARLTARSAAASTSVPHI